MGASRGLGHWRDPSVVAPHLNTVRPRPLRGPSSHGAKTMAKRNYVLPSRLVSSQVGVGPITNSRSRGRGVWGVGRRRHGIKKTTKNWILATCPPSDHFVDMGGESGEQLAR